MENRIFKIITLLCIVSLRIFPQEIRIATREYNFSNFSLEEGLEVPNINSIYQDSKGFIWICGRDGVAKFDGINFINYNSSNGLPSGGAGAVTEDNKGDIWFGTWNGMAVLHNNKFYLDTSKGMPRRLSWGLFTDKDGTIWSANYNGLFHINPNLPGKSLIKHYTISKENSGNEMRTVSRNSKGELIVGAEGGCYLLKNDSLIRYHEIYSPVYGMIELDDGRTWYCGWGQSLNEITATGEKKYYNLGAIVLDIVKDENGNVFLATWDKGIFKYDGKVFTQFTLKNGLPFNSYWTLFCDMENILWFGTWGDGVSRFSGEQFTKFTEKSGLLNNRLLGISPDKSGNIWFGSGDGITKLSASEKTFLKYEIPKESHELYSEITEMMVLSPDEVWGFGYATLGFKIKKNKLEKAYGLTGYGVKLTSDGKILGVAETSMGEFDQKGNIIKGYHAKAGGGTKFSNLYEDNSGNIWITSDVRGINLLENDSISYFGAKKGFTNKPALAILQYMPNRYLISVPGKGILNYYFNNGKFRLIDSITSQNGLLSGNILSMKMYKGSIYAAGTKGLNIFELEKYKKGRKAIRTYSDDEGLSGKYCKIGFIDSLGGVWLSTNKGAFRFDPEAANDNLAEPLTNISGLKLFFEEQDWSVYSDSLYQGLPVNLDLPYHKNHLTFTYIGVSHSAPSRVNYKYKLEGYDKSWSPAKKINEATYSNISPGTYTFMVIACNKYGDWNKTPVTFVFTVSPPFWRTIWFYALGFVIVAILFYIFIRYREQKLRVEKSNLELKVKERTSELKSAYDEIEEKQKEIIDSIKYAKRIQLSLLASEKYILKSIKRLKPDTKK